jgi:hypothetical protein
VTHDRKQRVVDAFVGWGADVIDDPVETQGLI